MSAVAPPVSQGRTALSSPWICATWTESHRGANTPSPSSHGPLHRRPHCAGITRAPDRARPSRTEHLGAATRLSLALTVARQGAGATPAPEGLTWFRPRRTSKGVNLSARCAGSTRLSCPFPRRTAPVLTHGGRRRAGGSGAGPHPARCPPRRALAPPAVLPAAPPGRTPLNAGRHPHRGQAGGPH